MKGREKKREIYSIEDTELNEDLIHERKPIQPA